MSYLRWVKYLILFLPLLLLPLLLQLSANTNKNALSGAFIDLTRVLPESNPLNLQNHLVNVVKERLDHGWECVGSLPNDTKVWKSYVSSFVISSPNGTKTNSSALYAIGQTLKRNQNLWGSDTQPGQWDAFSNLIFLSTKKDENPNATQYFLSYSTFKDIQPSYVKEERLDRRFEFGELQTSSAKVRLIAFPLRFPLWVNRTMLPAHLKVISNGKEIPFAEKLLRADEVSNQSVGPGWNILDQYEENLYQASVNGVLRITDVTPDYKMKPWFKSGLASLSFQAKADFQEQKMPKISIFLKDKKIDEMEISSTAYNRYSSKLFVVTPGQSELEFRIEEPEKNRNISILETKILFHSGIVIAELQNEDLRKYSASYSIACPFLAANQFFERLSVSENDNVLVTPVNYGGEIRKALVGLPEMKFSYSLKIPRDSALNFGYAVAGIAYCGKTDESQEARLAITIKEPLQRPRTIFSSRLKTESSKEIWHDISIRLTQFEGKLVDLTFEFPSESTGSPAAPLIYLSNPFVASESSSTKAPAKHIIVIAADALRSDHLSCYGYFRKTSPNIDAFAREGVVFENAISQASWTLPSFSSFFTSLYPSFHRAYDFESRSLLNTFHLVPILKSEDYRTAAFINNPCLHPLQGFSQGFDRYDFGTRNEIEQVQKALEWMKTVKNAKSFLFLHLLKPHEPYTPPQPFSTAFSNTSARKVETSTRALDDLDTHCRTIPKEDLEYIISQYDGEILYLYSILKDFFVALKHAGIYDDSIIVFLSDHGEEFREHRHLLHGTSVYQEQIHVPLIIKFPKGYQGSGMRVSRPVEVVDIFPTLLNLIHLKIPAHLQGESFAHLLHGNRGVDDRTLYSETQIVGKIALIRGRYKYIYTDPKQVAASANSCAPEVQEELYDLLTDPKETRNLFDKNPQVVEQFRKEKAAFDQNASGFLNQHSRKLSEPAVLDETVKEELRSLGYLQ